MGDEHPPEHFTQLTDLKLEDYKNAVHDANPMFGADGMIYYQSERDGIFNIWKMSPKGGAAMQVTKHTRGGVRFPSISPDGKTITYSNEFDLWVLPIDRPQPRKLAIDLGYVIDRNLIGNGNDREQRRRIFAIAERRVHGG